MIFMFSTDYSSQDMKDCIKSCLDCYRSCFETAIYCLNQGGRHAEASHVRTLLECSEISSASASFMMLNSEYHYRTCEVCAEICEGCASACEKMFGDKIMQACANVCRACANLCRKMSNANIKAA